jgi:hypothetical protein
LARNFPTLRILTPFLPRCQASFSLLLSSLVDRCSYSGRPTVALRLDSNGFEYPRLVDFCAVGVFLRLKSGRSFPLSFFLH